jgi:hypothetical protein
MAPNNTTTPALTTHVIKVGVTIMSSPLARRFFLVSRLSLDVAAFRFPLSPGDVILDDVAEFIRAGLRWASACSSIIVDSGTTRSDKGSSGSAGLVVRCNGWSLFGNPLAAAAQDRRVERLARSAASWSGWCDGEIML